MEIKHIITRKEAEYLRSRTDLPMAHTTIDNATPEFEGYKYISYLRGYNKDVS